MSCADWLVRNKHLRHPQHPVGHYKYEDNSPPNFLISHELPRLKVRKTTQGIDPLRQHILHGGVRKRLRRNAIEDHVNGIRCSQRVKCPLDDLLRRQIRSHHEKKEISVSFQYVHRGHGKNRWGIYQDIVKFIAQLRQNTFELDLSLVAR